ncbi:MAG: hypothetical protein E7606_00570 [Ruminococcaceae bacterium]|nr:hypothetical protein [Oscillospiraceae bacterium]
MKKILSCLLAVLMITVVFAMTVSAQIGEGYKDYGEVYIDPNAEMRLDADMDDVYLKATPWEIKYVHLGYEEDGVTPSPPTPEDTVASGSTMNMWRVAGYAQGDVVPAGIATGTGYMVYDGEFVWLYVDIIDDDLVTKAPDPLNSSFRQDSVEFMMDWTNEAPNNGNAILQARMTHEGYISGREDGPGGISLFGSIDDGGPNPVTWLKGDAKHTEKGWACEFRIKVPENFDKDRFSMAILINDYDETAETTTTGSRVMICADDVRGSAQWYGANFGSIKFDYKNYQPETGDMSIVYIAVAMVLALGLAAGTVVSMKKRASK